MKIFFMVFWMWIPFFLFGQSSIIQGKVSDVHGKPLDYANVFIEGSLDGSTTNKQGAFSFTTKKTGVYMLICSFIGFEDFRQKIEITKNTTLTLDITLAEKALNTEAVSVTASAFTSGDGEGVTLTPLEVVTTPGAAADIFWAIKSYPGVQQVDEGAGLFVRGGDVSETAVILDGAYLNHPYRYESPNGGFFGTITPFLLKGTYFSSGGYGAEHGNALSGALVMESVDLPAKDHYTIGVGLAALSAAMGKIIIPDKLGVSLSGNYSDTKTMFDLNNNRRKFSRYPEAHDVNLNTTFKYSKSGSFKLFVFREVDKIGIEITNPEHAGFFSGDSKNNLANLKWKHLLNRNILLQGNLAFSNFENTRRLSVLDMRTEESQYQLRLLADYYPDEDITIKMGVESFDNRVDIEGKVPQKRDDLNPDAPVDRIDLDYRSQRTVGFVQMDLSFDKLKIMSGIRAEYEPNLSRTIFDPRLSVTYAVQEHVDLTLAAGRYHQFPEPYYYDRQVGNPKLGSLSADHFIAGFIYQKENTIFRLEGYYKDYRDLLLKDKLTNYTTNGHGFARGMDLFLKHSFSLFKGRISYSYLDAKRRWMEAQKTASPDFDITHNLNVVLQANLSDHVQLGMAYRFATGKPYTSAKNKINDSRVPDYQKVDLNTSYLYRFFEGNLTIFYIGVTNLLKRDNIFDYYYSADYRERQAVRSSMLQSVYFGITTSF